MSIRKLSLTCGAPLRNRTVDLLLTITTISQPSDRRTGPDQAKRWLTLAETGPGQPCPAAFCPPDCPRDDLLMTSEERALKWPNTRSLISLDKQVVIRQCQCAG
jgi:hypothetical protein